MLHRLATSCMKLWGRVAPRAPLAVAAALAAVLGWQLGALAWWAVPDPAPTSTSALSAVSAATLPQPSNAGYEEERIVAGRLFGEPAEAKGGAAPLPEEAPETQLNLTLRGVLTVGAGDGFAFIATGRAGESVYTPGQALPGNARLERVYGDRVLLSRNGALETLWLDRDESAARRSTSRRQDDGVTQRFDSDRAARTARDLRARLREEPAELMRAVQFEPYEHNGKLHGYRVLPRGDATELLRGLGLTPDDVVTSINGIPLDDRRRLGEVVQALRTADEASVRFLRDGTTQSINIPIADAD